MTDYEFAMDLSERLRKIGLAIKDDNDRMTVMLAAGYIAGLAWRIKELEGKPEVPTTPPDATIIPGRLMHADWCPNAKGPYCICGNAEPAHDVFGNSYPPRPLRQRP